MADPQNSESPLPSVMDSFRYTMVQIPVKGLSVLALTLVQHSPGPFHMGECQISGRHTQVQS